MPYTGVFAFKLTFNIIFISLTVELEKAITENPPSSHPNHVQQQWMKELLFMTADNRKEEVTESVMSEIGSVSFDRRLDSHSIVHTPRAMTPVHQAEDEEGEPVRNKRMRFQVRFWFWCIIMWRVCIV